MQNQKARANSYFAFCYPILAQASDAIFAAIMQTAIHNKARFNYNNQSFDVMQFCAFQTSVPWLIDVQNVARFWLEKSEHLELQTSGSTGIPKKIVLPKAVLQQSATATLRAFNLKEENKAVLFLPCAFVGGKMMVIRTLVGGLHLHLVEPKLALPALQDDVDFIALTPMQAANSISQLNNFSTVLLGGGPVPFQLEEALQKVSAKVFHSYGMTETASHIALRKVNGVDTNNRFYALEGVRFRQDARQCLVIDAPLWQVSDLVTNDVVELLDDSHFVWKGRADNVINSGGIKIFPEEIEKQLEAQIHQPFFVGSVNDAKSGERLVLFVEGVTAPKIDFSVLKKQLQPKKVAVVPAFVFTGTDKINREKTIEAFLIAEEKA